MIIQNLIKFLYESFASLVFMVLLSLSGGEKSFGRIVMFYLGILGINCYLNFIKQGNFDIFNVLFPHMTSFEIKDVIQNNFLVISFFVDYVDEYFLESPRLQFI